MTRDYNIFQGPDPNSQVTRCGCVLFDETLRGVDDWHVAVTKRKENKIDSISIFTLFLSDVVMLLGPQIGL